MTPELMPPTTPCPELDVLLEALQPFVTYAERIGPPSVLAGLWCLIQFSPVLLRLAADGVELAHCTRFSERLLQAACDLQCAGLQRLPRADVARVSRLLDAGTAGLVLAIKPITGFAEGLLSDGSANPEVLFRIGNQVH
jgi:hypothetical protein